MSFKIKKLEIYIESTVICVIILSGMFGWVKKYLENYFVCFLFIIFHELSHMLVASICGIEPVKVNIRLSGLNIVLEKNITSKIKKLLVYFAGPMFNLVLAILFCKIKFVFAINIALMVINMIPIYPLDGYEILKTILEMLKVKKVRLVMTITQKTMLLIVGMLGAIQLMLYKNPSLAIITFYIILQDKKTHENSTKNIYQKYYKNVTNF